MILSLLHNEDMYVIYTFFNLGLKKDVCVKVENYFCI